MSEKMAPRVESTPASGNRGNVLGSGYQLRLPILVLKNRINALVVDSDYTSRAIERSFLNYFGVDTVSVESRRVAVDLLAYGERFNLVIIDKFLLEMDGFEATRRIRAMDSRCRILAVSAATFEEYGREFLEAGADEFIEKPLWPEQLMNILIEVDNLLG